MVNLQHPTDGATALIVACCNGHTEIVGHLICDMRGPINLQRHTDGATALIVACDNGHTEVVRQL